MSGKSANDKLNDALALYDLASEVSLHYGGALFSPARDAKLARRARRCHRYNVLHAEAQGKQVYCQR